MAAKLINTPGTKPISKVVRIKEEIEAWALREHGVVMSHFYGSTTWKDHSNKRCLDIMTYGDGIQTPTWASTGKPLTWAESRDFGNKVNAYIKKWAKRFGANGVIWWEKVAGFPHTANPPYRGPWGVDRPYSGPSKHQNHNHLEVDSTPYVALPVVTKPDGTVTTGYPRAKDKVVYLDKLKPGQDNSDSVYWLELALKDAGYTLDVDGYFGSKTRAAVKASQEKAGNDPQYCDGIPGPRDTEFILSKGKTRGIRIEEES